MTNMKRALVACAGTIALACAVIQPAKAADIPPQYPQYGGPPVEEGYREPPRAYRYAPAPPVYYSTRRPPLRWCPSLITFRAGGFTLIPVIMAMAPVRLRLSPLRRRLRLSPRMGPSPSSPPPPRTSALVEAAGRISAIGRISRRHNPPSHRQSA